MTTALKITGFLSTLVLLIIIPIYTRLEPGRQTELLISHQTHAVLTAAESYAENCVVCHGAAGEGIGSNPAVNTDSIHQTSDEDLFKTISRGRVGTQMAAWAVEEGGIFTNAQVDDFVTLIKEVNWEYVSVRVDERGLTPPPVIKLEVTDEMIENLVNLPGGAILEDGLLIYAENCAACHGANGSGSTIAPAIDSTELRDTPHTDLIDTVTNGVPGTLMAGWGSMLSEEEISSVVALLYRWPEIVQAGVAFPDVELSFEATPAMIQAGGRLFEIACKTCHGSLGYGSPMAPAVNNSIFLSQTPDAAIYQIIAGGISGTLMPAWGSRLNDQEIQSIVAYLRSLEIKAPVVMPPILGQ